MGGTQSVNTAEIITDIAVNATQRAINECVGSVSQQQIVQADYVAGTVDLSGVSFTQNASVNMQCALSARKQNEIQSAISSAIAQYAESRGVAVLSALGRTRSEAQTNIQNLFTANVTMEDVQTMTTIITQEQRVQFGTIEGDFIMRGATFEQSARIVAEAIVNTSQYNSVINTVSNAVDQVTQAEEENPLSFITDIFNNLTQQGALLVGAIIIVIILVIAAPIILVFYAAKSEGGSEDIISGDDIIVKIKK